MPRQTTAPYNFMVSDEEVLQRLEAARGYWPEGEDPDTYDWAQYLPPKRSKKTLAGYEGVRRTITEYLEANDLGSVDHFIGAESPIPPLNVLKRIVRSKANKDVTKGVINIGQQMTAHSLAGFASTLLGAVAWYTNKTLPPNYPEQLRDFAYNDVAREMNLSYETFQKNEHCNCRRIR